MAAQAGRRRVKAVLGPTNTGKTHLAIERMMAHGSGMIGFPLRLLARENYDRVAAERGPGQVALITGEERIIPPRPRYFICTVEAMPLEREVEFLAIDEIQMCADPERGHVFTDRLLKARGTSETLLLGAETIRPLLQRLVPGISIATRPRFSRLTYAGPRKLTRLPRRSAVVAFSANDVYAIAELIRRQRGGAAIVLGALSPRARNAQVGMFQAGEVDYLVATDAIGMGLNMDIDHVTFSALAKYDGRGMRRLLPAELAQIAGRAGRYTRDGTFGTTTELGELDAELVEAIENHRFAELEHLWWRNSKLAFTGLGALLRSLQERPPIEGLRRAREADDELALQTLARLEDIRERARNPERLRLLWDVAQIPDFRKTLAEEHVRLLARIYRHLTGTKGRLPEDWVASSVRQLDRTAGDIDALMARIAHIRTWTFIAHRADWLADSAYWRETSRAIEDRLSDALHERLTQRFVDQRTAVLVRKLKGQGELMAGVRDSGEVFVEGQYVGRLEGFRFAADETARGEEARALTSAAYRALRGEMTERVTRFAAAGQDQIALSANGRISWNGAPVGLLAPGADLLHPRIEVLRSDLLEGELREQVRRKLEDWFAWHAAEVTQPLRVAEGADDLSPAARGLLYRLGEALGTVPRAEVEAQVRSLSEEDRKAVSRLGVRLGVHTVYIQNMMKPAAMKLRAILWSLAQGLEDVPPLPNDGRTSVPRDRTVPTGFYEAIGYLPLGGHAIRAEMVERVSATARRLVRESEDGSFGPAEEMLSLIGCSQEELAAVLRDLGYRVETSEAPREEGSEEPAKTLYTFRPRRRGRRERGGKDAGKTSGDASGAGESPRKPKAPRRRQTKPERREPDADSPFAKLAQLKK
jgi:ATP-dependent RNA helicase SUPV3L1/SUV3